MNRTLSWVCVIFVILIIGVPALVVTWNPQVQIGDMFKLGTDLQGGTSLIYELKPLEGKQKVNAKNTANVILDRIDPKRLKDYVVRPIGKNRLEIRLPGRRVRVNIESKELTTEFLLAEAEKERARVTRGKTFTEPAKIPDDWREFTGGILLTVDLSPPLALPDIQDRISEGIRKLQAERLRISWLVRPTRFGRDQHRRVQVWVAEPYADEAKAAWAELVDRGLAEHSDLARVKRLVEKAGHLQLRMLVHREKDRGKGKWDQFVADKQAGRPLASPLYRWYPARIKKRGLTQARQRANWTDKASQMTRTSAVFVKDEESLSIEVLVNISDGQDITGRDLAEARPDRDDSGPVIFFSMKHPSTQRFSKLMGPESVKKYIAIILDGVIQSSPILNEPLKSGGQISGYRGRRHERDEIVTILNSGAIEASIYGPISERTIGPELGQDNIDRGVRAMIIGSIVVVVFMVVYYLGAGAVAVFALALQIVLIIALMSMAWMRGTWTLPGIAGLVLTVGMSVDANVLIFERIREEKGHGGGLALAIKNGYARAFRTILDANLTTLITAVVLLIVGMEALRGFAIIIILGLLMNMLTAIVITRLVFEGAMKFGILKEMRMLSIFKRPDVNWMRFARIAVIVSGILIIVGIAGFFGRGDDKYDIEFTGGTQVALMLGKPLADDQVSAIAEVRNMVGSIDDPIFGTATVQELQYEADVRENRWGLRYLVSVRAPAVKKGAADARDLWAAQEKMVRRRLLDTFRDHLPAASTSMVLVNGEELTEEFLLSEAGRGPDRKDLPPEFRAYLGCIRLALECDPPMTPQQVRRKIDAGIQSEFPDIAQTTYEVKPAGPPDEAGAFRDLEARIQVGYNQEIGGKPAHELWTGIVKNALAKPPQFATVTSFSEQIGKEARTGAIQAIFWSLLAIVGYIWLRFARVGYGIAAIVALVHDVFITLGAVVIFSVIFPDTFIGRGLLLTDMKIGLPMIGAFLTLIGYSLNDTIVVFDRIRENRGKFGELSISTVNKSINQTFTRTILTSLTTLMVVASLYWFGGTASKLHGFAFVMLFGILIGTYSSMAVASPILVLRRHLMKIYTWFYPAVALAVLIYHGPISAGMGAFFASTWGPVWLVIEIVWLALAVAVLYAYNYDKRLPLLATLRWVVKGMATISILIPPAFVALGLVALKKPELRWATLGAMGCLVSLPLLYVLYKVAWQSNLLEPPTRKKSLT